MSKILVVEDDLPISSLISIALRQGGHQVEGICGSSEEGLLFLEEKGALDLIMLDICLPGENGLSFLRRLRSDPNWEAIPVIILTGKVTSEMIVEAKKLGVTDFVSKPFQPKELQECVASYIEALTRPLVTD